MHDYKYSRIVLPFIDQGKPIFSLIAARPVDPEDPDQPLKLHGKVNIFVSRPVEIWRSRDF